MVLLNFLLNQKVIDFTGEVSCWTTVQYYTTVSNPDLFQSFLQNTLWILELQKHCEKSEP